MDFFFFFLIKFFSSRKHSLYKLYCCCCWCGKRSNILMILSLSIFYFALTLALSTLKLDWSMALLRCLGRLSTECSEMCDDCPSNVRDQYAMCYF